MPSRGQRAPEAERHAQIVPIRPSISVLQGKRIGKQCCRISKNTKYASQLEPVGRTSEG